MMLTSTLDLVNLDIGPAAVLALLGYAVVFFGIILLMTVVMVMGKIFIAQAAKQPEREAKKAAKKAAKEAKKAAKKGIAPMDKAPAAAPAAASAPAVAPGTAGQLKLHDVPPKTAAMLMAIVADKMGKPINELRFISIKEVK